jgi:HD-GYP domain-containing protein (c-di-GMP phosphodiesterase class II)
VSGLQAAVPEHFVALAGRNMIIRMDKLIKAIAAALDMVEGELLGASTHHGKRVAVLAAAMGKRLGLGDNFLLPLTTCALLHDNALTEYILSERMGEFQGQMMRIHCEYGQRNVDSLMFKTSISGFVLYHHEQPDGGGPFGKREGEIPLEAELIGAADTFDVVHHMEQVSPEELPRLHGELWDGMGKKYTRRAVTAMLRVLDENMLRSLRNNRIMETAESYIPPWLVDMEDQVILNLADFVTHIIDDKSVFTRRHTAQIANKAWLLGGYYGYDPGLRARFYLAAVLHDIGKLAIPAAILEKPGRLSDDEFEIIKSHVSTTRDLLEEIDGFEDIRGWAANHHEKLDGSGYPLGKKAAALDFNSRLLACIDIYQAVSEDRPYHPARGHNDAMKILNDMADAGKLDPGIVRDLDKVLAEWSGRDVPPPNEPPRRKRRGIL